MVDHVLDESVQHELLIFGLDLHLDCEVLVLLLQARGPHNWGKNRGFRPVSGRGIDDCWSVECSQQFRPWITVYHSRRRSPRITQPCLWHQRFDVVYISRRVSRREQNRIIIIVRIGKSKAVVTITERLHSRYCTVEANYRHIRSIVQRAASLR